VKLGLVWMPRDIREAVRIAIAADAAGFDALGLCDSPVLYDEVYPSVTACLSATERLRVGPNVTNPVTRHWTIHAASLRAHEKLAPGRAMLGIGPGDGAVYGIGREPAGNAALEAAVREIHAAAPGCGEIQVAAGGLRRAGAAGRCGDAAILGTGLDPGALAALGEAVEVGSREREDGSRVGRWGLAHLNLVAEEDELEGALEATRPLAIAYARHALASTFTGKNVPEPFQAPLAERLGRYSFDTHAQAGGTNPNGELLAGARDLEDYVMDRFSIVGTAGACRQRLLALGEQAGLDGIWLIIVVPEPEVQVARAAVAFADLLAAQAAGDAI
jgi:alkanesulfonate monooxygenase SsuD/methylene tetrahydromethanopterin reductase-like flavin-dependent oxidoreductase (luciferase family)